MARQRSVQDKPIVRRRARAVGELAVSPRTLAAIAAHSVEKGDPVAAGELAGLLAMKRTPDLIPHCHTVPLSGSRVELRVGSEGVSVDAEAEAVGRTGVEMEALLGATVALLTVWDMVKYLEKDASGLYPNVRLGPVSLAEKHKSPAAAP
ncbi:MAG: cyclic pyranopterin monophosphate synthase MoaC [Thermoplasmata archaeon]|nr:cyclic pyranopterin monophosphate synthase MoaC [Thermoplasmata archaeon]MCI4358951.1 cyclic pyranopterin monophosphate synthase MoaC [Thermoplasmata archaeon]